MPRHGGGLAGLHRPARPGTAVRQRLRARHDLVRRPDRFPFRLPHVSHLPWRWYGHGPYATLTDSAHLVPKHRPRTPLDPPAALAGQRASHLVVEEGHLVHGLYRDRPAPGPAHLDVHPAPSPLPTTHAPIRSPGSASTASSTSTRADHGAEPPIRAASRVTDPASVRSRSSRTAVPCSTALATSAGSVGRSNRRAP